MRTRGTPSRLVRKKVRTQSQEVSPQTSLIAKLHTHDSSDWIRANQSIVLKRFKEAYKSVGAYQHFIKKNGISAAEVKQVKDAARIPPINKKNYLRAYPWEKLCIRDVLSREPLVLTATSGSTGHPFYIPRTDDIHDASMLFHRLFIERCGLDKTKPTLVIVGFGMGVWIGGVLTYEAFTRISDDGWEVSLITPGVNKKEIFESLAFIGHAYKQIVLCGYPPFVKDLIDDGPEHGVNWQDWDMRIVCAAEAFSEHFREYLMLKTGMKDTYRSIMNIYGSAELGTMATETPLSILLRRLALKNELLYRALFTDAHRLPTLAQFIPDLIAFEAGKGGEVYATGGKALPLVRYDIGDQGGVFSYDDALAACNTAGISLATEIKKAGIRDTIMQLPFVYLYERADLSTKLYGAIIYPEHVKIGLQNSLFEKYITGRFTMTTENDTEHNEYLEINIELQHGVTDANKFQASIVESVVSSLTTSSNEYRYLCGSIRDKVIPHLVFWPHEHPTYFSPGVKQKWVKK